MGKKSSKNRPLRARRRIDPAHRHIVAVPGKCGRLDTKCHDLHSGTFCRAKPGCFHGRFEVLPSVLSVDSGEGFLYFLAIALPRSGRYSFTTLNTALLPMVIPKLTPPSFAESWLGGNHSRATNAPAATPLNCEMEMARLPSSWRARTVLQSA